MDACEAFGRAARTGLVLGSDSKIIHDDLHKFRGFRGLVDPFETASYDSLVLHWYVAENTAPDAGKIFCDLISKSKIDVLSERSIRRDDLFRLIPDDDRDLLFLCYDLIGTEGAIEVVKGGDDRIDVYDSYRFDAQASVEVSDSPRSHARIMLVDGFIENASEIHHALQKASETRETLIIFARGFSPDVLNTLSVNNLRKTLDVLPFSIALDLDHVNDFYDLEVLTGCQTISSEKGQLISSMKFESLPVVTHVKYSPHEKILVMRNDATRADVRKHLTKLRERLESSDAYNSKETAERIRRMTGLICMLTLKDDMSFERRKLGIRRSSRLIDHYSRFGLVETSVGTFPKSSYEIARRHAEDSIRQMSESVILRF